MKWHIIKPLKAFYRLAVKSPMGIIILAQTGNCEVVVEMAQPGTRVLILGLINASGKDNLNLKVTTVHSAANTHAETVIHGLVTDQAQARIKGLIKIEKKAQRITDFLTERILLLSPQAMAVAEPELEIEADDVRASHAATVSSIDSDERFYLMSRGISAAGAEKLITDGFLTPVLSRIDNDKIRQQVCLMLKK